MAIPFVEFSTAIYYYFRLSFQDLFSDNLSPRGPVSLNAFSEKRVTLNRIYFFLFVTSVASLLSIGGLKQKRVNVGAGKIYCFTSLFYRKQHMWSSMCTKPVTGQTLSSFRKSIAMNSKKMTALLSAAFVLCPYVISSISRSCKSRKLFFQLNLLPPITIPRP
jgi:hypothetical protein